MRSADVNPGRLRPRFAKPRLVEALSDTPVVLIHGPRQSGKTTLARIVGDSRGFAYFSFDEAGAESLRGTPGDAGYSSDPPLGVSR